MRLKNKAPLSALLIILFFYPVLAQEFSPFRGEINADNINIRADSTVSAAAICKANKGGFVDVVGELYDWYKIKLPKEGAAFIKKDFVGVADEKFIVIKDSVNLRLTADEAGIIIGKANKNEAVNIQETQGGWYKILPTENTFGWVHKKFVSKVPLIKKAKERPRPDNKVVIEGVIEPYGMVFKRSATHKLVTPDKQVFLLKGNRESLNAVTRRKVKITGKAIMETKTKFPLIEVEKVEEL